MPPIGPASAYPKKEYTRSALPRRARGDVSAAVRWPPFSRLPQWGAPALIQRSDRISRVRHTTPGQFLFSGHPRFDWPCLCPALRVCAGREAVGPYREAHLRAECRRQRQPRGLDRHGELGGERPRRLRPVGGRVDQPRTGARRRLGSARNTPTPTQACSTTASDAAIPPRGAAIRGHDRRARTRRPQSVCRRRQQLTNLVDPPGLAPVSAPNPVDPCNELRESLLESIQ